MRWIAIITVLMTAACRFEQPGDVFEYGKGDGGSQDTPAPDDRGQGSGGSLLPDAKSVEQTSGGSSAGAAQRPATPRDKLLPGQSLVANQALIATSPNGCQFKLVMQIDGNLVLYANDVAKWNTATPNKGGQRLVLQTDGNLVLYTAANAPLWNTKTFNRTVTHLILQTDGNLVLYSPDGAAVWNSGSVIPGC